MVGSFACSSFVFSFPFLVKFDFVWEIQQAMTVGVWDNVPASLSCMYVCMYVFYILIYLGMLHYKNVILHASLYILVTFSS